MNGILIRNAYMPKNCWDCSGRIAGDIQTFNEAVSMVGGRCPYLERIVDPREFDMHSGRHPDCPIVEVPPHSDLIDRDALITEVMDSDLDHLQRDDWKEIIQIVEDAPAIIEGNL